MTEENKPAADEFMQVEPSAQPEVSDAFQQKLDEARRLGPMAGPPSLDERPGADGSAVPQQHQPPGLYLLFLVEMWERFSYYGMRGLLVLYLISLTPQQIPLFTATTTIGAMANPTGTGPFAAGASAEAFGASGGNPGRGWPEGSANLLYGWYGGLAYLLPLLGGYLADKFLGTHRSMVVGAILISIGHITLGVTGLASLAHSAAGMSVFIAGLAVIILGTGFFKPCVSVMVGQLYGPKDPRREGGFTIFYMGINLGAFLCAFVCGTLGEKLGWHWGFGAAAVGMIAGLIVYLLGRPKYLARVGLPPPGRSNLAPLFFAGAVGLAALAGFVYQFGDFSWLGAVFQAKLVSAVSVGSLIGGGVALGLVVLVLWFIGTQRPGEKGPVATIFIFMAFNALFWIAYEQGGSTLNTFAKFSTDRNLLGWEVPATWFQSVNPLLILLLAPLFAALWTGLGRRGLDPCQPLKIAYGLLLLGGGYVFMVFAGMRNASGVQVGMFWLVATYTLHTLGELCLSPTGLSYVTKAAPVRLVALLMGAWFISSFLALLGGGYIASDVQRISSGEIEMPWHLGGRADFFMIFVVSSFAAGLLMLVLTPLLKKLMPPGVT